MPDVLTKAERSRNMAAIRGKNTTPELQLRSILHREGYRFRLHAKNVFGKPDLVFRKHRLAVFVDGCFWHRHHACKFSYTPKSRLDFWLSKFAANVARDRLVTRRLRATGWRVLRVWECDLVPAKAHNVTARVRSALQSGLASRRLYVQRRRRKSLREGQLL